MDFVEGTRCYFFNSTQTSVWLRDIGWWKHQEHFQKLPHVPWRPPDWARIYKRSFKLEAKWKQGRSASPSCTHLDAGLLWSSTEATCNFRIWNKTRLMILFSLPLYFLLLFASSNLSFPLLPFWVSFPCPLSRHLPGKDNRVPMEKRDAAEGMFERELWLQTFHLVLHLAKAGCRVAQLSEGGWDKRKEKKGNEIQWSVKRKEKKRPLPL